MTDTEWKEYLRYLEASEGKISDEEVAIWEEEVLRYLGSTAAKTPCPHSSDID